IRASAQETVSRRSYSLAQHRVFVHEWYEKTGAATEREDKEYRAKDLDVKTLPKGQMQILMTDDARGVLHSRLHVRGARDQCAELLAEVVSTSPSFAGEVAWSQPAFHVSRNCGASSSSASSTPQAARSQAMNRFAVVVVLMAVVSLSAYGQARK